MLQKLRYVYLSLIIIIFSFNSSYANEDSFSPKQIQNINSDTTFICGTCYPYCLDIPFTDVDNYSYNINGTDIPSSELKACDLDTSFVYSYFTLEGMGSQGPFILESWFINGVQVANLQTFNNPMEMANLMNQLDPTGNWAVNADFFIVQGGTASNTYSSMVVIDSNSTSTLPNNLITTGNGSALCIPTGNSSVIVTENATGNVFESFDIIVEGIIDIETTILDVGCDPNGNPIPGSIDITVTGGTPPYTYLWQGNNTFIGTAEDISNLSAGSYSVTVTDADDCSTPLTDIIITSVDCTPDIYVDIFAFGNNDGSSWSNAFVNLQDALAATNGLTGTIYVAQGTYYPTDEALRGVTFDIPDNTTLLGGFPTGGGIRKPNLFPTILSGEIDGVAGPDGNSYHVVKVINVSDVTIDGFIIQDGNANNAETYGRARGGGIYCNNAFLSLANCVVQDNYAIYGGGVFATLSPKVKITDSELKSNEAQYGSALYLSNQSSTFLNRIRVTENNSLVRCAIEINNANYTNIKNTLIANNISDKANALALIATNRDQGCDINNSTIIGGATDRFLIITQIGFGDQLDLNINNSIVAHQTSTYLKVIGETNNNIFNFNHNTCYFQGSFISGNGTNNLFSNSAGDLLLNSDFSVSECSPVVNAGNNSLTSSSADVIGNPRVFGSIVDIGAYEAQTTCFSSRENVSDESSIEFSIQPNPTKDFINIMIQKDNIQSEILDIAGQRILTTTNKSIDMTNLPKGIYLLRVYTNDGLIGAEKIIKL